MNGIRELLANCIESARAHALCEPTWTELERELFAVHCLYQKELLCAAARLLARLQEGAERSTLARPARLLAAAVREELSTARADGVALAGGLALLVDLRASDPGRWPSVLVLQRALAALP